MIVLERKIHQEFDYLHNINVFSFSNHLVVPAGIIQGYFFHPSVPSYLNFGSIGSVLAHETMHGFDLMGVQYGKNGTLTR